MRINKSLITLSSGGTASTVPWSGVTGTPTTLSGYGITDAVPSSRTLTINGVSYDLSANRTWTISSDNIYTANGTLTSGRSVTLGGFDLTFVGGSTSPIIHSTGRILLGGAAYNASYNINVSGNAYTQFLTGSTSNFTTHTATFGQFGQVRLTEIAAPSTPTAGFGFVYAKSDKKIYWKNSDGTEYDLTASGTGTVTSVGLSSSTSGITIGSTPITTSGTITLTIATASGSQNGLLSSTDWTTFNNKFNLPSLTSGSVLFSNGTTIAEDNANLFWDDSNNRLGIGTSSPTQRLTVEGGDGTYLFTTQTSATNKPRFQVYVDDSNGVYLVSGYDTTAKPMRMTVGGVDRIFISTTGDVGIGTLTPSSKLEVAGTITANGGNIRSGLGVSTGDAYIDIGGNRSGNGFSYLDFVGDATYTDYGFRIIRGNSGPNTNTQFNHRGTGPFEIGTNEAGNIEFFTNGSSNIRQTIKSSGQLQFNNYQATTSFSGTAVANLQVDSSGNVITTGISDSGTYTPTLTNVANVTSSTAGLSFYQRIGNIVNVTGYITLTPTTNGLNTTIRVSLPIASNFTSATNLHGLFVQANQDKSSYVDGDTTNDTMTLTFAAGSVASRSLSFTFQYEIL